MSNPLLKVFKRILQVPVRGSITCATTDSIAAQLNKRRLFPIELVTVPINSISGSLTQAKTIADLLRNFGLKHNVPIYCFAEDQCLGVANLLLVSGTKAFASEMSLLGDYGFTWSDINLNKLAKKYNIKQQKVLGGQNQAQYQNLEPISQECIDFTKNYLKDLQQDLITNIMSRRQEHIRKKQVKQKIMQDIFSKPLILGNQALRYGLIDQLDTCEEFKDRKYFGYKTVLASKNSSMKKINGSYMKAIGEVITSSNTTNRL